MHFSKLKDKVCRICLEHKTNFNWNDEIFEFSGVSYKDCYYKYTEMEETDADFYPTNLCAKCANEVKNAHILFENALKSFIILQNTVKANGYEFLSDSCNGSQKIIHQPCTFDENNIESHKNETIDIDEVICYSPLNDDDVVETENNSREASISRDDSTHNFESAFRIPLQNQAMESLNKKDLINSVDKAKNTERKDLESLNTALELKLRLEICGSKLLKSTTKPSTQNSCTFLLQTTIKKEKSKDLLPLEKDQGDIWIEKTQYSEQKSSTKTSLENTDTKQSSSKNGFEETYRPRARHRALPTSFVSIASGKEEKTRDLSANSLLNENDGKNYMSSSSSNTNGSTSLDSQTFSLTDRSIGTKNNFKPSEISLLQKIYGEHFDIKSLQIEPKPKKPSVKICQYCSLQILGKCHLLAHEATHLEHRERSMICPKCGIKLYTKLSLSDHMKTHEENRQKQHKCEFCEKAFFHKGALNVHRRIHLGLMVKCQVCSREFYRKIDLERHLVSHSASPLQKTVSAKKKYTVQCQYCNKFILTSKWKAHKAAHLKQPQVKCKICNKDFYSRASLSPEKLNYEKVIPSVSILGCVKHLNGVHRKTANEYSENIHYYADWTSRMSHLIIKQQEIVLPVEK